MNQDDSVENFLAKRNKALIDLDLEYARKMIPGARDDDVLLMSMHKARYSVTTIPAELRHASGAWLRERGLGAMSGPLLPEGELPE